MHTNFAFLKNIPSKTSFWKSSFPIYSFHLTSLFTRSVNKQVLVNANIQPYNVKSFDTTSHNLLTRRYIITGSQRTSNYLWASIISFGGLAFLLTGFAAFLNRSVFLFNKSQSIAFLPQGLIMCFYGSLGCIFGVYLWCTIFWGVGNGFNEFDKKQGLIRIFRWGLPGKDRRIDLVYKMEQVEGVRVELKEGINPRRTISLRLKTSLIAETWSKAGVSGVKESSSGENNNKAAYTGTASKVASAQAREIPLTRIGQPIGLEDIESEASELAQFLQVPLDSFYDI